jgi:hypothetical protein
MLAVILFIGTVTLAQNHGMEESYQKCASINDYMVNKQNLTALECSDCERVASFGDCKVVTKKCSGQVVVKHMLNGSCK